MIAAQQGGARAQHRNAVIDAAKVVDQDELEPDDWAERRLACLKWQTFSKRFSEKALSRHIPSIEQLSLSAGRVYLESPVHWVGRVERIFHALQSAEKEAAPTLFSAKDAFRFALEWLTKVLTAERVSLVSTSAARAKRNVISFAWVREKREEVENQDAKREEQRAGNRNQRAHGTGQAVRLLK